MTVAAVQQLHMFLTGLVQGVGMRAYVRRQAQRLGLVGFVRNLPDGRVEVVAEGAPEDLEALLASLQEPAVGRVDHITHAYHPASGKFRRFEISF
ncbi:MAG: acylphosphatase [Clostridia bacterium]|nr:acylphosphatase [Clostridia bacterium]